MRKLLTLLTLLLLAGCGGSGGGSATLVPLPAGQPQPEVQAPAGLTLALTAEPDGADQRVVLTAESAADLYQLAGSLEFDAGRYQLVEAVSGGGLGAAADSYFVCEPTLPGRLDFAYTRRYYGPGASGDVRLLEVLVSPVGTFSLGDFALSDEPDALLARDSARQRIAVTGPEVQR